MEQIYKLIEAAGNLTRNWLEERERYAEFAKPYWRQWGGEELVNHMTNKYVNDDSQSIVEWMYNLDFRNKELVVKYLQAR